MSNKKQKAQDHIPIHDINGNFIAFGHPGFLRKLSKDNRGYFQKSLISLQTDFVLSGSATPDNYPELIPFLKDNNVNANQTTSELDTTTSPSSATAPIATTVNKDPNRISGNEKFNAKFDQRLQQAQNETVKKTLGILSDALEASTNADRDSEEEHLRAYGNMLKNLPKDVREKLLYGDPPGTVSTATIGTNSNFGIDPAMPGTDRTTIAEVSYGPSREDRVFSEAEQKAYFAEFNARHRFLQNINVEVMKTNMGETEYTISADYRGEITVYQYFKCHIRCDLTLAEYSDNLVFKDGVWKSVHVEKWLGTYYATYTEWEDVFDKASEGHDNRALHPENRKELETSWQQFYHDLPIEAINAMMNFNPQGLKDRTYKAEGSKSKD
jgi:hypothetical protein